eukprot:gene23358-43857_t
MTDPVVLERLGLRKGEPIRFRKTAAGRWVEGRMWGIAPDGSIKLYDPDGSARNLRPDAVERTTSMATRERRGGHLGAARAVLIACVGLLAGALFSLGTAAAPITPGAASAEAADKSYSFDALRTVAELRTDGSMLVTEQWTYVFDGGPFNFGIRSF